MTIKIPDYIVDELCNAVLLNDDISHQPVLERYGLIEANEGWDETTVSVTELGLNYVFHLRAEPFVLAMSPDERNIVIDLTNVFHEHLIHQVPEDKIGFGEYDGKYTLETFMGLVAQGWLERSESAYGGVSFRVTPSKRIDAAKVFNIMRIGKTETYSQVEMEQRMERRARFWDAGYDHARQQVMSQVYALRKVIKDAQARLTRLSQKEAVHPALLEDLVDELTAGLNAELELEKKKRDENK